MKKVEKYWRLVAKIGSYGGGTSQELNHEPTEEDVQIFANEIGSNYSNIIVEVFWKQRPCTACNGSGYYDHNGSPKCGACNGTGKEMHKSLIFKTLDS